MAEDFGAHSILAGDNAAFTFLAQLMAQLDTVGVSDATRAMLQRSMPEASAAALIAQDAAFITSHGDGRARRRERSQLRQSTRRMQFAAELAYPVVVKRDGYAAGKGVTICASENELRETVSAIERTICGAAFCARRCVRRRSERRIGQCGRGHFMSAKRSLAGTPWAGDRDRLRSTRGSHCRCLPSVPGVRPERVCGPRLHRGYDGTRAFDRGEPVYCRRDVSACFGCDLTAAMLAAMRGESRAAMSHPHARIRSPSFPNEWRRSD